MSEFIDLLLPWWWGETDKIMDGFISVILSTFIILSIILMRKTFRRASRIDSLSKEVDKYKRPAQPSFKHNLKVSFERNNLAEAWQEFEDSLIEHPREDPEVVYKTDDSSLFFGEDRLLDQQLNLRFWNSVPALLVGLGILGTFVGLVWGLRPFAGIDFTEIEKIGDAIKTLLSGVSTAFVTSVWGMSVSLVFNLFEKRRMGRISQAITNLQRALDKLFTLTTQEAILFRQEDELAQQTAALKSFSTDLANEIKSAMAQGRQEIIQELQNAPQAFSNAMSEQLAPSLDSLNNAIEELRRQKEESSTDAIQQLVEEFQKSLSGSATAQMETLAETVSRASESLTTLPNQLTSMMAGVQEQIDQTRRLLSATSEEQTGQLQDLMDRMLNAFQTAIATQQSGLSETTNQSIQTLQDTIAQLRDSITSTASQVATESEATTNRLSAASEEQTRQMQEMTGSMLNALQRAIDTQQSALSETTNQSIQTLQDTIAQLRDSITSTASQVATESEAMTNRLSATSEEQTRQTQEMMGSMLDALQRAIDTQQSGLSETTNQSIQTLQDTIAQLRDSITSTASQVATESEATTNRLSAASEEQTRQMQEVTGSMLNALQRAIDTQQQAIRNITSQTEATAAESTDRLRQLVNRSAERLEQVIQAGEQSVRTLLSQQNDQIRAINAQLANSGETLASGRDMLEEMNTSITSVRQMIETTQALSNQLMIGANRLESAGQQLTNASSAFNQENREYLAANRATIQQLQDALAQSRQLLNDSAQRFQTIDDGLNSIFTEIQGGLTNYSTTTRDSISTYLSDFSSQLTSAANVLAGSVEAQGENVEELGDKFEAMRDKLVDLIDMIERILRQRGNR